MFSYGYLPINFPPFMVKFLRKGLLFFFLTFYIFFYLFCLDLSSLKSRLWDKDSSANRFFGS